MTVNSSVRAIWSKYLRGNNNFERVLEKVRLVSASDGKCVAELTVAEEHSNIQGTLHGGLTATIVDCISGVALSTHKKPALGVSVDLHVSYSKGVRVGEGIVIEANTLRSGKTLAFLEVLIKKKSDGSVVAKGSHTKFIGNENVNLLER